MNKKILDSLQKAFDAEAAMNSTKKLGGPLLNRAKAFAEARKALKEAGVSDASVVSKLGDILALIMKYLPDIIRIVTEVLALFGK
jgi:hypothetical protein